LSSILKAFKKIDESSPADDSNPLWPNPGEARDTITRGIKKRWLIRRVTTYILVAACVISLAVLLYFRQADRASQVRTAGTPSGKKSKQGQLHRATTAKTVPTEKPSIPAVKPKSPTARPSTPPVTMPPPQNPPPALQDTPAAPTLDESPMSTGRNRSRPPLPKKSMKAATKIKAPTGGESARTSPPEPESVKSSSASPPETSTQYSRLQSAELILQAIAWAPEPSERIAVVNGSIVKEGDSVAGYTLMRIRKDDIVLNDGVKTWQLEFDLQQ
jgi:hypothetical protein